MADGAVTMQVAVPDGVGPGGAFAVTTPDGQVLQLTCPDGVLAGGAIQFSYIPIQQVAEQAESEDLRMHPDDLKRMEEASALAAAKQEELMAAGAIPAEPLPVGEFLSNTFPPALFAVNQQAIVTRSSGEESGCSIYEVFLTAMGPQYNVYLGQDEAGQNIFKWCGEADLRPYP
uniref:Uncharacterized protein n=1 Tax=Pfiesteria piscicida TaxID=71001 RepID=A3E3S3_PFIPI|nr:unknown [Pfiesteria piscicida]